MFYLLKTDAASTRVLSFVFSTNEKLVPADNIDSAVSYVAKCTSFKLRA